MGLNALNLAAAFTKASSALSLRFSKAIPSKPERRQSAMRPALLLLAIGAAPALANTTQAAIDSAVNRAQAGPANLGNASQGIALFGKPLNDLLPDWYLAARPNTSQTGVIVMDMGTGRLLVADNSERTMLPASVQKLFLATAATQSLGNDFRFNTRLYSKGARKSHLDTLYLEMEGSPLLSSQDLQALFRSVKALGVTKVDELVLISDDNEAPQARGWVWDDLGFCYAAPVSNLTLDKNCVSGSLAPTKDGKAVKLILSNDAGIKVDNRIVYRPELAYKDCKPELTALGGNEFRLWGCYSGKDPLPLAFAISDTHEWMSIKAPRLGKAAGIDVGKVRVKPSLPKDVSLLASHSSAPLPVLVKELLKESDNLIADSLLKRLGQKHYGKADFYHGAKAMKDILGAEGIDLSRAVLLDGSGLSRYNLINPRQLMNLLLYIHNTPSLHGLIESMPVSGLDGTLAYRRFFNREPLKGKVVAKTGSMGGVANLAGFINGSKTTYGFVILENGLVDSRDENGRKNGPVFSAEVLKALLQAHP
ncbi:D-alanyl-D-alanine carboxypeptidase/D-alanyl-D-alanine-endopeptidase [Shewanella sp. JM162201]|uniref:D-alanyl-D-alanine carboxypeptidase/D-alanyl-D-alanine-endopeptidase n=1 Tax=Shewanella jiangmenensis TaxID=2837387 RepID=A0ABS5V4U8_9GAMM|nr:D-alanyl-D-alanine carboxypeptidase/D-alanyl-D-alanine-endopeptidase [Shewanella jiangmenensis]MBT1445484.1 D-alanyl-D-alanine carboxypeptidase/D-alanyl-D-alanine-endopeptidase [Shewanella jiangmenensis]